MGVLILPTSLSVRVCSPSLSLYTPPPPAPPPRSRLTPLPPTPPHAPSMPRMCMHKPPPLPSILPTTRLSRSETQPSYSGVENPNRRLSQRVREDSGIGYSLCMPLRQLLSKTHPDRRLSLAVSSASLKHHTLGLPSVAGRTSKNVTCCWRNV